MTKTALITGASSGIGRATAAAFLRRDWRVYATARDTDDVADLADAGCATPQLDVTDDAAVDRVVDRVIDETGRIDCLVNNAGYAQYGPVEDVPMDALHDQFDVNVYGAHRMVRAVMPHMRRRRRGTVVNVSSPQGRVASAGMGAYAASKAALESLSDSLRVEADEYDVDVVVVEPGPVRTAFSHRAEDELANLERRGNYESVYDLIEDSNLLASDADTGLHPSEVAHVIVDAACASDPDPRYVIGTTARLVVAARHLPDRWRDGAARLVNWLVS
jgi:NAD(P)-dependent dehydrogenase (short-subunit alcohol dehydrogenase family)